MTSNQIAAKRAENERQIGMANAQANQENARANTRNARSNEKNARTNARNARTNRMDADTRRRAQRDQEKTNKVSRASTTVRTLTGGVKDISEIAKNRSDAQMKGIDALASIPAVVKGVAALANDPRWYISAGRAKDIASMPWGDMYGTEVHPYVSSDGTAEDGSIVIKGEGFEGDAFEATFDSTVQAPGVLACVIAQTIGEAGTNVDEVNRAANKAFDKINVQNGRVGDYEPCDLTMYMLGVSSLHSYVAHLMRAYRCLSFYSEVNEYYPRALIHAMGFDFDDLLEHIYDFKGHINWLVDIINTFPQIPDFTIGTRWIYEMESVFQQEGAHKSQTYLYTPRHFLIPDFTDTAGTSLRAEPWLTCNEINGITSVTARLHTFDEVVTYSNNFVNAFYGMQDARIMRSDIEKAYGSSAFSKVRYVETGDKQLILIDPLSLLQFKNAVSYGSALANGERLAYSIWQQDGIIQSIVRMPANNFRLSTGTTETPASRVKIGNHVLTSNLQHANDDAILECTRLIAPINLSTLEVKGFIHSQPVAFFAYYPYRALNNARSSGPSRTYIQPYVIDTTFSYSQAVTAVEGAELFAVYEALMRARIARAFDYSPAFYINIYSYDYNSSAGDPPILSDTIIMDWDYFSVISDERLATMNKSIALYMLGAQDG